MQNAQDCTFGFGPGGTDKINMYICLGQTAALKRSCFTTFGSSSMPQSVETRQVHISKDVHGCNAMDVQRLVAFDLGSQGLGGPQHSDDDEGAGLLSERDTALIAQTMSTYCKTDMAVATIMWLSGYADMLFTFVLHESSWCRLEAAAAHGWKWFDPGN